MTVQTRDQLDGAQAIGRKGAPSTAAPDVRMPVGAVSTALPGAFGSHAVGRRGQVMVIDEVELFGEANFADNGAGGRFNLLRKDRYDGLNAGIRDLSFMFQTFNSDPGNAYEMLQWHIRKLGFTEKNDEAVSSRERANLHGFLTFSASVNDSCEGRLKLRYLSTTGAERQGLRKGAWGVSDGTTATNQVLIAAPGLGRHHRIRTLLLVACGGPVATDRITLGSNATAVNDPLKVWYASGNQNRGRIVQFLTDLDIPCPENQPITLTFSASFLARHTLIVGAENCAIERANHISLTSDPQ